MIEVIAFDADDTLWENEVLYHEAIKKLKDLLSTIQSPELIEQRLDETEIQNLHIFGYGIKSFTLSMIETAILLSGGEINGQTIQHILEIAKEMLTTEVKLFDHTEETLKVLSKEFDLLLITKGDQFEQQMKIDKSGLSEYFRHVEIVVEKSQESYLELLDKYKIDPTRFLMVGNSLRSDILPVVGIGARAVYIPYDLTWSHELVTMESDDEHKFDELEHIGQLPGYIISLDKL
jgi:putative hydrolase of the HAD superfamily